ncbi:hypothetical protein SY83_20175 [Paenibacillus swuensis]|uniref:Phosphate transport regulator n=1 Tax=Paenibacillus swuensis TaxID=1178515 RepID=A0A172TN94_9BACL|nr:DUF47 family protein [Paenibacillus swuensis]ANE48223.1 hypothetical protein SY83_20175 [Paenibacillus swuensis]
MFKKKDVFFTTLEAISDNLLEASLYFAKGIDSPDKLAEFAKVMKDYENKGDRYTHLIYKELNKTFITPIERDDIAALTSALDDVIDEMEACASRFEMYEIGSMDAHMKKFGEILVECTKEIQTAMRMLSTKKLLAMREHCIRINELENVADDAYRISIKEAFAKIKDPIELIKKKEIYEKYEAATDCCEKVAHTLESVIMGNS